MNPVNESKIAALKDDLDAFCEVANDGPTMRPYGSPSTPEQKDRARVEAEALSNGEMSRGVDGRIFMNRKQRRAMRKKKRSKQQR